MRWIFLLILILAIFLRFYRLDQLTTFGGDQGQDFLVVKDMVLDHRWTLLGIKTSVGAFFQGPVYLYILYPFFLLFHLKPIAGAVAAVTISISTIILLYFTCLKYFSKKVALSSSLLFAVSPEFIKYGNTPLYQHFLPFFIVLSLFLFLSKKENFFTPVFLGVVVGLGIELHLLNISLALAYFLFYLLFLKNIRKIILYCAGAVIGISPTILFELRHQFLNIHLFLNYQNSVHSSLSLATLPGQWIKGSAMFLTGNFLLAGFLVLVLTIFLLFTSKLSPPNFVKIKKLTLLTLTITFLLSLRFSAFEPHYLLPVWILFIILFPFLIFHVFPKYPASTILFLLIAINLYSSLKELGNNHGYNMPPGLTLQKIDIAGSIIGKDSVDHQNFNIASLLDGGTRNYPLRYTAEIYGAKPDTVDHYPANNYLYLFAGPDKEQIFNNNTWEINSLKPFTMGKEWNMEDNVFLYRLDKIRTVDEN